MIDRNKEGKLGCIGQSVRIGRCVEASLGSVDDLDSWPDVFRVARFVVRLFSCKLWVLWDLFRLDKTRFWYIIGFRLKDVADVTA